MKYFFILGRNIELSLAELVSYFEKEKIAFKILNIKSNSVLIDIKNIDAGVISQLGGTIAIGKTLCHGNENDVTKYIKKNVLYFGESNKLNYSLVNFSKSSCFENVLDCIKYNFKQERLKANYHPLKGIVKMQNNKTFFGSPSKIKKMDCVYFLTDYNEEYFFGVVNYVSNVKENEDIDMNKPTRRESLAISPRLSKILINLSCVKKNENLLDPFCGIGVILQEGMIQDINVVGVEIDKEAVLNCKKNISWLKQNYKINSKSSIINSDSSKVVLNEKVNGVATEPFLGEIVKKIPSKQKAQNMINEFEDVLIKVLLNVKKYLLPDSKIAFTSPYINIGNKRLSCNINKICSKTKLKLYELNEKNFLKFANQSPQATGYSVKFPLAEFREKQIVGRNIFVLIK